jgi:nitrate/nitrite-specific signal transduction histidine kinase
MILRYMASEALTDAAGHAQASVVHVELEAGDATVRLAISDDGLGAANLAQGSGLVGLELTNPTGNGARLLIEIPLEGNHNAVAADR